MELLKLINRRIEWTQTEMDKCHKGQERYKILMKSLRRFEQIKKNIINKKGGKK